jgi:PhnB protein
MAKVSTYLNFPRNTEEAFNFYKTVFHSEFAGNIARMSEVPQEPGQPPIDDADKNLVMHVELPILGGHTIMGTDAPESMGFVLQSGNNIAISLMPDSKDEAERLFAELSDGGEVEMPLQQMFWGDYFASFRDKYNIRWMINYTPDQAPTQAAY